MNTGQDNMEPTDEEITAALDELDALGLVEEVDAADVEQEPQGPTFVALIGVPGSGKSDLADRISGWYGMEVVDNYAQNLSADLDLALGPYSNYVTNLMVAMEREKAEHANRKDLDRDGVTCGTLIESLAYAALLVEYHNMQITTPMQQGIIARETVGSQVLSLMIQDMMRYHKYFYLKLAPAIEIPGQEPKYDNYTRSLDNAIGQIIQTLGVPVIEVRGDLDTQMEVVKETLAERYPDMEIAPRPDEDSPAYSGHGHDH